MLAMERSFSLVERVGDASLYRFNPGVPADWSWEARNQPVLVGAPPVDACDVHAPDDAFEVTGISLQPTQALPGDTITVTVAYHHDAAGTFSFPVVMHLRFDHESLARARTFPGEKYVRRFRDRRSHVLSRFRADVVPGHGCYEPDLWPVGFDLYETFRVAVPSGARLGRYRVEVALDRETVVPNFHVRDLLFNRDHYSGRACTSLQVSGHVTGGTEP